MIIKVQKKDYFFEGVVVVSKFLNFFCVLIVSISVTGLYGSEQFCDGSINAVIKKTAPYYGSCYGLAWTIGTMRCATKEGLLRKSVLLAIKERSLISPTVAFVASGLISGSAIARTVPLTAPIVFGSVMTWHEYKKMRNDIHYFCNENS